ncbi:MAG: tetratricopeptide repeat protein, partial [Gammaproteobacteria bacterium]|nr:tetratricopeptide repeat protein [Gammaproteobacteria bacterium]
DDPYQLEHQKRQRKFEATMKAVVELSLEQVKTICKTEDAFERAKRILLATTYLAPESAIPKGLLGRWLPDDETENQINDVLESLRALSLLEEDSQIATYRIHQVVQDTLRLEETSEITQRRLLQWHKEVERYLNVLDSKLGALGALDEQKYKVLEVHMIALAQHLSRQQRTDAFLEAETFMYRRAGLASSFQGKETTAKSYFENALRCCRQMPTRNTAYEGDCLNGLGATTLSCGDPLGAKKYLEEALPILQAALGDLHAEVGQCWMNLGLAICSCGDPQSAEAHLEAALPILKTTLGKGNATVGRCLSNLGSVTLFCGDPQTAKRYLEEALPILQASLGKQHSSVGGCLGSLGLAIFTCGDPRGAKKFLDAAIPILKATLGEKHASVGQCWMNLGLATSFSGDPRSGKVHLETALPILKTTLGENHADVGRCLGNLGSIAFSCGDPQGAERYLEEALPILNASLGENHPNIGACLTNLGMAKISCGDLQSGKKCLESALLILKSNLGETHADVGRCMMNLGSTTLSCGDVQGAKELLEEALMILEYTVGKRHSDVGLCKMNLGLADWVYRNFQRSKKYLEEALPILKATLGEKHADVARCLQNLGMATLSGGDSWGAKKNFEEALPIIKATLGERHMEVGRCCMNLGEANLSCGIPQIAKEYLETAVKSLKGFFGENDNTVITCQKLLDQAIKACLESSDIKSTNSVLRKAPALPQETILDLISEDMMPLHTTLAFEVAQYSYNLEQIETAIKVLSLLIETNPAQPQALMLKAQCHIATYEFDAAEDCIATALSLDNDLDAKLVFEELNKARENYLNLLGKVQNTLAVETLEAREKIIYAKNLCALGKHSQALVFLNQLAQQSLDANLLGAIFYQSARCYFLNQNWNEALNCIDKSLEINHHPDAEALRLKIIEAANSAEKIERLLSILVIEEPENSQQFRPN